MKISDHTGCSEILKFLNLHSTAITEPIPFPFLVKCSGIEAQYEVA